MNLFIYSDESGVFDNVHNDYFVFGGLILLGKESKEDWERLYRNAEIAITPKYQQNQELKAAIVSNKDKGKLFRSLNKCHKFSVVVKEKNVLKDIFNNKKSKQRYLDYAYKIAVKKAIEDLINKGIIIPNEIENIYFFVDEHNTATDGKYELREALEQELIVGTFNYHYSVFYKPILPYSKAVTLEFCNSAKKRLVRAADIIANHVYYLAVSNQLEKINKITNLHNIYLP